MLKRLLYAVLSAFGFQRSSTFSMAPPFVFGVSFQAKKNWSAVGAATAGKRVAALLKR
ncbi:MAG: hypothetical protein IKU86_10525 [Thermoguttaceae bacterium]|nr:hypothetical protein [Thermoguttaceae bacterium]